MMREARGSVRKVSVSSVQSPSKGQVRQRLFISVYHELDSINGIKFSDEGLQGLTYGNLISMRICILPLRQHSLFGTSIEHR